MLGANLASWQKTLTFGENLTILEGKVTFLGAWERNKNKNMLD